MDGDGYPELLLVESGFGHILVFHYKNGAVYGFVFPFRGLENVKKDASFISSGGIDLKSVGTVCFSNGKAIFNELCFYDGWSNGYRINGKEVGHEKAAAYLNDQAEKENAAWHIYNELNLVK